MKIFEVKKCKYGRGIFAIRDIKKGELIHEAPIIISPSSEYKYLEKTKIMDYVFWWGDDCALALGYGSLFNHSYSPNAIYEYNKTNQTIDFYALTDIKANDEILINYNGDPDDNSKVWFDVL